MKENCACGFIIEDTVGWLLCHPTNSGNRWDFPKGGAEPGEDHLCAAKRELFEETGISFFPTDSKIIDLGQHPYQDHRDLHLFYVKLDEKIDTKMLYCKSMVSNPKGDDFPEMDAYAIFKKSVVLSKLSKRMKEWVVNNVPIEIIKGDDNE